MSKDTTKKSKSKMKEPYFQTPNAIFDLDVTATEKLVLIYFYRCGNQGSRIYPSYKTIAEKCGISRRTVISTIKKLEAKNLIEVSRRRKNNKDNYSNLFKLPSEIIALGASETISPASETVAPNKELNYKELYLEEELIEGFPAENLLYFDQFKDTINDDQTEEIMATFMQMYKKRFGEHHPPMKYTAWKRESKNIFDFADTEDTVSLTKDDWEAMIEKYFNTKFRGGCNYRFPHFNRPEQKKNRFYEVCYY